MGNVITINEGRPDRLSLALSNQGTRVFLDLLVECALSRELTWSQFDLIDFLCEKININITAPGIPLILKKCPGMQDVSVKINCSC